MTFEEFWKENEDRYIDLAVNFNLKLAINTACEDAWNMAYEEGRNKTETIKYELVLDTTPVCKCNEQRDFKNEWCPVHGNKSNVHCDKLPLCNCYQQRELTGGWCPVHGSELIY